MTSLGEFFHLKVCFSPKPSCLVERRGGGRGEGLGEEELEERGGRRWGDWEVRTEEEFDS